LHFALSSSSKSNPNPNKSEVLLERNWRVKFVGPDSRIAKVSQLLLKTTEQIKYLTVKQFYDIVRTNTKLEVKQVKNDVKY